MLTIHHRGSDLMVEISNIEAEFGSDCVGCVGWPASTCGGCSLKRETIQGINSCTMEVWSERRQTMVEPSKRLYDALIECEELLGVACENS